MSLFLKKLFVRVGLVTVSALNLLRRGGSAVLPFVLKPFGWIGQGIFQLALPLYRRYRSIRQRLGKHPLFRGLEGFGHFLQRYALYAALVGIGVLVSGNNILARTIRPDEVGVGAAWTAFAGTSEITDIIIETTAAKPISSAPNLALGGTPTSSTASAPQIIYGTDDFIAIGQDSPLNTDISEQIAEGNNEPAYRTEVVNYTVVGGDTLSTIARRYSLGTQTLLWANNLSDRDFIKPGQVLKIPPQDGVLITVKKGDTVASLAKKYSGKTDTILSANQLASADDLDAGEQVLIPGGEPPAPPAPAQTAQPQKSIIGRIVSGGTKRPASARATGARFVWPTSDRRINQYYRGSYHTGVDIEGVSSSPIYAAAAGKVIYSAYNRSGYGLHIIIDHGNGYTTLYAHASKTFVKSGDRVDQGETIAMVGTTGRSTGTHLHFEIRTGAGFLNPLSFF